MRSSVYLCLYNFSTAIVNSSPALEINLTNWERQCWCISLGIRVASSIKMPLCFSHGQWRNGSWKMRKYLGIWLQIWVPCHVCGLAQFFGLGNRLIIAMLDGFQNVILCFHPNRSPGNTTVCPLFLVGLNHGTIFLPGRSESIQIGPPVSFRNLWALLVFLYEGMYTVFFWCLGFCRFKFSTVKHVASYWEKINVI